jgi:hypothetical protein
MAVFQHIDGLLFDWQSDVLNSMVLQEWLAFGWHRGQGAIFNEKWLGSLAFWSGFFNNT